MRYRDRILPAAVVLALSLTTLCGLAFLSEFPLAARADSIGLDALGHQMFGRAGVVCVNEAFVPETVQQ